MYILTWLKLEGYELIRADHPEDKSQGGKCIYYKSHFPVTSRPEKILSIYLYLFFFM